jgi:hypothetical protein
MKAAALALLLSLGFVWPATAGDLRLEFQDGYVTLKAHDVPVRQILAEWARRGQTKITNGEKVVGTPVTLELNRVPEKQALDIVLHSVAGYLAAPRMAAVLGASAFDRIMVMPTSSAPPATNGPRTQPPGMAGSMMPAYQPQPDVDLQPGEDSDEPVGPQMEQPAFGMPGEQPNQAMPAGANGFVGNPPGMVPNGNVVVPGAVPPPVAPDPTNPLRAYQPPQQQQQQQQQPQNGEGTPQVQPPGPSPMQPGTVTNPNPGQIQPQQQQNEQPQ